MKKYRKWLFLFSAIIISISLFIFYRREKVVSNSGKSQMMTNESTEEAVTKVTQDVLNKGYNLPIDAEEEKEANEDCLAVMGTIQGIYKKTDKENSSNRTISDKMEIEIQKCLAEQGKTVYISLYQSDMSNYEKAEEFLKAAEVGEKSEFVLYELHSDGGIGRNKFIFDGSNLYVLFTSTTWNQGNEPIITFISYTRVKEWNYTKKGWFCYELCVPESPEVTDRIGGNVMVRIKPLKQEYREIGARFLRTLGYQGNNLLCSEWDKDHMDKLDYNGMYQYLYSIKYQGGDETASFPNGIPQQEFESLIMEYLPVTVEQIRQTASFDELKGTYNWQKLGCQDYAPNPFGISEPEITDMKDNEDGTVTLTIDAVCEMMGKEAVITHELTISFLDNGGIKYLANHILGDGLAQIPEYQYRFK